MLSILSTMSFFQYAQFFWQLAKTHAEVKVRHYFQLFYTDVNVVVVLYTVQICLLQLTLAFLVLWTFWSTPEDEKRLKVWYVVFWMRLQGFQKVSSSKKIVFSPPLDSSFFSFFLSMDSFLFFFFLGRMYFAALNSRLVVVHHLMYLIHYCLNRHTHLTCHSSGLGYWECRAGGGVIKVLSKLSLYPSNPLLSPMMPFGASREAESGHIST